MSRRQALLLGMSLVLLAAGAVALRYTIFLDLEKWALQAGVPGSLPPEEVLAGLHQGPGPCLRYAGAIPPDEAITVAESVHRSGISALQLGKLVGRFTTWVNAREDRAHRASMWEEMVNPTGRGPWTTQVILRLNRNRLRALDQRFLAQMVADSDAIERQLSVAQRQTLRDAWDTHPRALTVRGLLEVLQNLRSLETVDRTERIAGLLSQAEAKQGRFPDRLQDLALRDDEILDGWGYPLEYETTENGVRVASLGRDHFPGGDGFDADVVRMVMRGGRPAEPGPKKAAACGTLPGAFDLTSAEVDRILEHSSDFAGQARVTPFFDSGQVKGFKVSGIEPGSVFERIGLCEGDVVTSVIGLPLTSPDSALEIYARLKGEKEVPIRLRRGDREGAITVRIQ